MSAGCCAIMRRVRWDDGGLPGVACGGSGPARPCRRSELCLTNALAGADCLTLPTPRGGVGVCGPKVECMQATMNTKWTLRLPPEATREHVGPACSVPSWDRYPHEFRMFGNEGGCSL